MADDEDIEADIGDEAAHEVLLGAVLAHAEARGQAAGPEAALISAEAEKLSLETRHLALRFFNDRLSVALKLGVIALGALIVVGLAAMAWGASQDRALVVEAFSAPPSFAQRGVTGALVANDVMERLASITRTVNADSVETPSDVAADETDQVKLEIPDTGVSIGELWRALQGWLGHERRITGSLRELPDGRIELAARIEGHDAVNAAGAPGDLDKLEQTVAEQLFQASDPRNWVDYLSDVGRHAEALTAAQAVAAGATTKIDRSTAFALWAAMTSEPNRKRALADISLRVQPTMLAAYWARSSASLKLGRDEAAIRDARQALTLGDGDQPVSIRGRGAAIIRTYVRLQLDELTGDFTRAATDEAEANDDASSIALHESRYAAWRHDVRLARDLLAEGAAAGSADSFSVAITRYEVDAQAGDWAAAAGDAAAIISQADANRAKASTPDEAAGLAVVEATAYEPRLAEARTRVGDLAGANSAIASTPLDCYRCLRLRGRIAAAHGDYTNATRWFAEAVREGPSLPFAYLDWAELLLSRGDAAGAVAKLRAASAAGPDYADPQELWGEALMQAGDAAAARARFEQANRDAPAWGRNHLRWGEALAKLGRGNEAMAQWQLAQTLDLSAAERDELARAVSAMR